jgi:hypothetical protein
MCVGVHMHLIKLILFNFFWLHMFLHEFIGSNIYKKNSFNYKLSYFLIQDFYNYKKIFHDYSNKTLSFI